MGLVYHALPLVKLENVHVNRVVEMWLSDEAVGMTAEEIQAHVELYGEFPLPLADPDEQRRVQRDRKMRILGGVLEVKRVLRGVRQVLIDLAPAQGGTAGGDTGIPDSALMSPRALAEAWGIPGHQDAIEKAFDRADLPDSAKVANENRKPREPRFNYRVGSVRPILDKLRDTLSRERPAKK